MSSAPSRSLKEPRRLGLARGKPRPVRVSGPDATPIEAPPVRTARPRTASPRTTRPGIVTPSAGSRAIGAVSRRGFHDSSVIDSVIDRFPMAILSPAAIRHRFVIRGLAIRCRVDRCRVVGRHLGRWPVVGWPVVGWPAQRRGMTGVEPRKPLAKLIE